MLFIFPLKRLCELWASSSFSAQRPGRKICGKAVLQLYCINDLVWIVTCSLKMFLSFQEWVANMFTVVTVGSGYYDMFICFVPVLWCWILGQGALPGSPCAKRRKSISSPRTQGHWSIMLLNSTSCSKASSVPLYTDT